MSILKPHQLQLKTEKMDELGFSNLPEGDVHNHRKPTGSSIDDCRKWRVRIEAKITPNHHKLIQQPKLMWPVSGKTLSSMIMDTVSNS